MIFAIILIVVTLLALLGLFAVAFELHEKKKCHIKEIVRRPMMNGEMYRGAVGIYRVNKNNTITMRGVGTIKWVNGETTKFSHGDKINLAGIKKRILLPSNYDIG